MSMVASKARRKAPPATPPLALVRRRGNALIKRTRSTQLAPLGIVATIALIAIVMAVLLEQVVLAQSAFKLARISKRIEAAEARQEELLLESARLESPARIERYAKQQLGMVEPTVVRYIVADVRMPSKTRLARARPAELPPTGRAAAASAVPGEDAP